MLKFAAPSLKLSPAQLFLKILHVLVTTVCNKQPGPPQTHADSASGSPVKELHNFKSLFPYLERYTLLFKNWGHNKQKNH